MKTKTDTSSALGWIHQWMQSVANGESTMDQRKLSSIYKRDIELDDAIKKAKKYKVHLVLLKDDKGEELAAAGKDVFTVLY